jgi:hypothetical protein
MNVKMTPEDVKEECAKIADSYAEKAWPATDIAADIRDLEVLTYGTPACNSRTRHDEETVLGAPLWTDEDHKNARRVCPTCGTPACNHPDRVRGEDALPIPPEALIAGRTVVQNFLPHYDWKTCEMIAEGIFREMLGKCSK